MVACRTLDKLLARAALTTGGSTKTALQAMPANTPIAGSAYLGGVTGGFTLNSKVRGPVTLKPVGGASQKGASQDSVLPVSILPPSLGIHFLIATTGRMEW